LKAVEQLNGEFNTTVEFHELAIDDQQSVDRFAVFIREKHGGLDILINNAGISIKV
jgi:carbonyl reductase 1